MIEIVYIQYSIQFDFFQFPTIQVDYIPVFVSLFSLPLLLTTVTFCITMNLCLPGVTLTYYGLNGDFTITSLDS